MTTLPTLCIPPDTLRTDGAAALFGPESVRADSLCVSAADGVLRPVWEGVGVVVESPVYQIAVLLLFVAYCLAVRAYRLQSGRMLHVLRSVGAFEFEHSERSAQFERALRGLDLTVGLAVAVAVVKVVGRWGEAVDPRVLFWGVPIAALLLAAARLWQRTMRFLIGRVTFQTEFVEALGTLRRMVASLSALVLIPVVLLYAFSGGAIERILFWTVVVAVSLGVAWFAVWTFRFFARRKVSILHWILYLCAVEAFPYSFVILAVLRRDV